jgi:hypothetical protein
MKTTKNKTILVLKNLNGNKKRVLLDNLRNRAALKKLRVQSLNCNDTKQARFAKRL